ncbi:MAG: hypothetical protein GX326_07180, partial [Clostridiaceae bacterium]|nr:hypothetical protein [Clostridiaceae bacterium]
HAQDLTDKIFSFVTKHPDGIIVVAGGDGSLNEATNALVNLNSTASLCPIPFGTANDFCKILYQNFDFSKFLDNFNNLKTRKIDLLSIKGKLRLLGNGPENVNDKHKNCINQAYILNVASFGFDSEVLKSAYEYMVKYPKIKGNGYYLGVIKNFLKKKLKTWQVKFSIDGKKLEEEVLLSALCNGAYYGNGFNPAPNFDLFDGRLNYVIAPRFSHVQFARLALKYKSGKVLEIDQVKHGFAKHVRVKSLNDFPIIANYDGILFESSEFEIQVIEKALSMTFVGDFAHRLL